MCRKPLALFSGCMYWIFPETLLVYQAFSSLLCAFRTAYTCHTQHIALPWFYRSWIPSTYPPPPSPKLAVYICQINSLWLFLIFLLRFWPFFWFGHSHFFRYNQVVRGPATPWLSERRPSPQDRCLRLCSAACPCKPLALFGDSIPCQQSNHPQAGILMPKQMDKGDRQAKAHGWTWNELGQRSQGYWKWMLVLAMQCPT